MLGNFCRLLIDNFFSKTNLSRKPSLGCSRSGDLNCLQKVERLYVDMKGDHHNDDSNYDAYDNYDIFLIERLYISHTM